VKDLICPHCAAPIITRVCEYCGRDTGVQMVSPEEWRHLCKNSAWQHIGYYSGYTELYEREVGRMNGVRCVLDPGCG